MPAQAVIDALTVDPRQGLDAEEAARRLESHGPNEMTPRRGKPGWLKFLEQFHQALVYILMAAALVSVLLEEWVERA